MFSQCDLMYLHYLFNSPRFADDIDPVTSDIEDANENAKSLHCRGSMGLRST